MPATRDELLRRIDAFLSDEITLTGEACQHGWDRAVCALRECRNPYAAETIMEDVAAYLREGGK